MDQKTRKAIFSAVVLLVAGGALYFGIIDETQFQNLIHLLGF